MIGAQIRPNYVVRVDDHIFVHELPEEPGWAGGRADWAKGQQSALSERAVGILDAPRRDRIPPMDETREAYLEIRDRHAREVVTVLEILSPANKRRTGVDRAQYLAERNSILASQTHLVEIDLPLGGVVMPGEERPDCLYSVLVSRAEERPEAGFWPIELADRLPAVPIPLRLPHEDAALDLQELLHKVYDEAGYEYDLYDGPPQPPLSPEEALWARQFVPATY